MAKTICLKASANKGQIIRIKGRNQGKAIKAGLQIEAVGKFRYLGASSVNME